MTSEPTLPPPTWRLSGEAAVAFTAATPAEKDRLPEGARALPGPALVFAVSYDGSPVGPYLETVVCIPAWYLGRPGFCVTTIAVDSEPALWAGLDFWGYPKVLGTMEWQADGRTREFRWKERDLVIRARAGRRSVPAGAVLPTVQAVPGGGAYTGLRIAGRLGLARIEIDAPPDSPLAGLAGPHRGTLMTGMRMTVPPPALLGEPAPGFAAAVAGQVLLPAHRSDEIEARLS
jgi:hypothetical protein